jgi:hypothetical protein
MKCSKQWISVSSRLLKYLQIFPVGMSQPHILGPFRQTSDKDLELNSNNTHTTETVFRSSLRYETNHVKNVI